MRTKPTLDFSPSLTRHSPVVAAVINWQCSVFHRSGHSEGGIGQSQTAQLRLFSSTADFTKPAIQLNQPVQSKAPARNARAEQSSSRQGSTCATAAFADAAGICQ